MEHALITSKSEPIADIITRVMKKERKQFHAIDKSTRALICSPVYRMLYKVGNLPATSLSLFREISACLDFLWEM